MTKNIYQRLLFFIRYQQQYRTNCLVTYSSTVTIHARDSTCQETVLVTTCIDYVGLLKEHSNPNCIRMRRRNPSWITVLQCFLTEKEKKKNNDSLQCIARH